LMTTRNVRTRIAVAGDAGDRCWTHRRIFTVSREGAAGSRRLWFSGTGVQTTMPGPKRKEVGTTRLPR
jgi:hypothetical protein